MAEGDGTLPVRAPGCEGAYEEEFPLPNQGTPPEGVAWCDEIPPEETPAFVPVVRPVSGCAAVRGIVVSTHAIACWTHWIDGRTVPCLANPARCLPCDQGHGRRRKGYLLVLMRGVERLALLELTEQVLRASPSLIQPTAGLRGKPFEAKRLGQAKNGRVVLTLGQYVPGTSQLLEGLPGSEAIKPLLCRIWGLAP